jgi:hypothetical protein
MALGAAVWGANSIDVGSPASSGWPYSSGVITIVDGADVTLSGGPTTNSVALASGATARLTLSNMTLGYVSGINASQAAQVTLLLEGTSSAGGTNTYDAWSSALIAAPVTIIDSASSLNAGTDSSSRSTEGTFIANGDGMPWYYGLIDPSIQGSVTVLGGVLIARNDDYYWSNGINGTLTAKGGVTIAPHGIGGLVYPAGSTAIVFVGAAPNASYQNNHDDLIVCGSELSISGNTITLNAPLTIPPGVTLRVPSGWTLNTGGYLTNNGTVIKDGTVNGDIGGTGTVTP